MDDLTIKRLQAIARELSKHSQSKATRIDTALLRINALVQDLETDVESLVPKTSA